MLYCAVLSNSIALCYSRLYHSSLSSVLNCTVSCDAAGGYFASLASDESLLLRLKDDYDGAEPAASSVAADNLTRLAALLPASEADYKDRA